jgi:hypothetical protein
MTTGLSPCSIIPVSCSPPPICETNKTDDEVEDDSDLDDPYLGGKYARYTITDPPLFWISLHKESFEKYEVDRLDERVLLRTSLDAFVDIL